MAPKIQGSPSPQLVHEQMHAQEQIHMNQSNAADAAKPADGKTNTQGTSAQDTSQSRKASPAESSSKKGEAKFGEKAKRAELQNKFEKTKKSNDATGVKNGPELNAAQKKVLTETLLKASDKDLREIIQSLPKRDAGSQRLLLDVLNSSDKLMKRVQDIINVDDKYPGLFELMEKQGAKIEKVMDKMR